MPMVVNYALKKIERQGRQGIAIEAVDTGPGIADIALALSDGYSTAPYTRGPGLPGGKNA